MLVMPLARWARLRPKEQAAAVLRGPADMVKPAGLVEATLLAGEDVAIDARLQAVLVVGEGVEAEVEQALTVSLACGVGEEVSQQALPVLGMGLAEQAPERPEGSHLAVLSVCPAAASRLSCLFSVWDPPRMLQRSFASSRLEGGGVCARLNEELPGPGSHSLGTVSHSTRAEACSDGC